MSEPGDPEEATGPAVAGVPDPPSPAAEAEAAAEAKAESSEGEGEGEAEAEPFDALAAFEAAEAQQAAEAAANAARAAAEAAARPAPGPLPVKKEPAEEEGEEEATQWQDIFGDDEPGAEPAAHPFDRTELTFASIFGEDVVEEDADVLTQGLTMAPTQDLPALSFEHLFGEEESQAPLLPRPSDAAQLAGGPRLTELRVPPLPHLPEDQRQKLYYVRIPQALHFEERPYSRAALPQQLEKYGEKTVITPDNVVRWRHVDQDQVQSNARIVQWDNGDLHLYVGREVYDISKHPLTEDNLFLFARSLDGTHAFQHKFTTAMRVRTTLSRKSNARDLVSQKIRSAFLKKVQDRQLRMGLSDRPGRPLPQQQPKEAAKLQRKRDRHVAAAGGVTGVEDAALEAEEQARMERLHRIKRGKDAAPVRRGRVLADDDDDMGL